MATLSIWASGLVCGVGRACNRGITRSCSREATDLRGCTANADFEEVCLAPVPHSCSSADKSRTGVIVALVGNRHCLCVANHLPCGRVVLASRRCSDEVNSVRGFVVG